MATPPEASELEWSVRPARGRPGTAFSAAAVIAGSVYGAFVFGGVIIGFLAVLVLVGGVGPFFVTTRYRLTREGVEVNSPFQRVRRSWESFRRVYPGKDGVSLSPFSGRHVLEPYRSVMLRYNGHRDDVLAWVERYGPAEEQE